MELGRFDEGQDPFVSPKFYFQPVLLENLLILVLFHKYPSLPSAPKSPPRTPPSPPANSTVQSLQRVSQAQHYRKLSPWQQTVPAPSVFIRRAGKKRARLFLTRPFLEGRCGLGKRLSTPTPRREPSDSQNLSARRNLGA